MGTNFLDRFTFHPMEDRDGERSAGGSVSQNNEITFTDGLDSITSKGVATELPVTSEVVSSPVYSKEAGNDAMGYAVGGETPAEVPVKPKGRTKKVKSAPEVALLEESSPVVKAETVPIVPVIPAEPKVIASERVVSAVVQEKAEIAPVSVKRKEKEERKILFPQKGDVFQDVTSGDRIVVEGIDRRDGELGVSYRETYASGKSKGEGKIFWKIPKSFYVMVDTKEMQKNDPLKESNPEFYVMYEEQMKKLESMFSFEIEKVAGKLNKWSDSFKKETNAKRYNELIDRHSQLFEQLEEMSEEWLRIKDSLVVTRGLEKIKLFLKLRSFLLDERIPEDIRTDIIKLRAENIDYEPNVELVERKYQKILLDRKAKALKKKCERATTRFSGPIAEDAPNPPEFVRQVDALVAVVSENTSSQDIENISKELDVLENRVFLKKQKENTGDGSGMSENAPVGGFVRNEKGNQGEVRKVNGNGRGKKGNAGNQRTTRSQGSTGTDEEESLVSSGAILQVEQDGKVISQEQRQTAYGTMQKIDTMIREKKFLARRIFEDPENIGKISKGKYKSHVGLLNDLGRDAEDFLADVKIAELQAILEKVKGVEFTVESSEAPKKVIETPVASATSVTPEQPKERTYEDLYKILGQNGTEISFRESFFNDALSAGLQHIRIEMEFGDEDEDMKKFVGEKKEDLVEHFSRTSIASYFDLPSWTLAEKELFVKTFVRNYLENFVK